MWKRVLLLTLCFLLMCPPVAHAADQRTFNQPILSFSGNTATCGCNVTELGKTIQATMELWDGSELLDSWAKIDTHSVKMSETCTVRRGHTYTLKVKVLINGVNYGPYSITKQCP